jgi:hypothetical protein
VIPEEPCLRKVDTRRAEPTPGQRRAFDLIGTPVPLTIV